jgi:hypothetical protein
LQRNQVPLCSEISCRFAPIYAWRRPKDDKRPESRRVQEDSIAVFNELPKGQRATFLERIVVRSPQDAAARGQTLSLIRPQNVGFSYERKTSEQIAEEHQAYIEAACQPSFFGEDVKALEPCPYTFTFKYQSADGKPHSSTCDDWETAATFYRFRREYGEAEALRYLVGTFNEDYPAKGMAFALGTHSRFPKVWLLVGVIRVDRVAQLALSL